MLLCALLWLKEEMLACACVALKGADAGRLGFGLEVRGRWVRGAVGALLRLAREAGGLGVSLCSS